MVAISGFTHTSNTDKKYEVMPEGDYPLEIVGTEMVNGNIKATLKVFCGPHIGRLVWDVFYNNDKSGGFSNKKLSALCKALDMPTLNDTEELHGKLVTARLVSATYENKTTGKTGTTNRVAEYKPYVKADAEPPTGDQIPF